MSRQNGEDHSAPKRSAQKVNDEENQSQSATINRIQAYRDELAEYQLLFARNELSNELSEGEIHRSYHQLVSGLAQLLMPYLRDDGIQSARHYWERVKLGEFDIDPPSAIHQPDQMDVAGALGGDGLGAVALADPRNSVEPKHYEVYGLQDFMGAEPEWTEEWSVMVGPEISPADLRQQITEDGVRVLDRRHRNEPIRVERIARVPMGIVTEAATQLEHFIRDLGLDVDLQDQGTDIIRNFDMSGDTPQADYGQAEYSGDPEI
jgi:hypothetical protein